MDLFLTQLASPVNTSGPHTLVTPLASHENKLSCFPSLSLQHKVKQLMKPQEPFTGFQVSFFSDNSVKAHSLFFHCQEHTPRGFFFFLFILSQELSMCLCISYTGKGIPVAGIAWQKDLG